LIPVAQVKRFLDLFDKYGRLYGALFNTETTEIMMTASGKSVVKRLLVSYEVGRQRMLGMQLW